MKPGWVQFELLTQELNKLIKHFPEYRFEEFHMPDKRIERWWTGGGECLVIIYKDEAEKIEGA